MGNTRALGAGMAIFLIAAGAVLRFAVATTSTHGFNIHVAGIIVMLAGALALVASVLVRRSLNEHSPSLIPASSGHDSRRVMRRKAAANADVAAILDSGDRDGPDAAVLREDDL
jgi:hypothetical protein